MTKVVIIGAGVAGLACGIYAQMNGFDTHIYEMHSIPGGECTGWDRGGYHFDGCVRWLMGSKPGTALNEVWRETGALDESVEIINHEVFQRYEEDGRAVNIYTDAGRLEKHLLALSPGDKKPIGQFIKALRAMGGFGMPVDKPMDMMTGRDGLKFAARNIGKLPLVSRLGKTPLKEYAARFKDPVLRRALLSVVPENCSASALVMTLAGMCAGDSGYPEGGSRAFARRMEQRYLALGGQVSYNSRVESVIVENGTARGVRLAGGGEACGDMVISCADAYATLDKLLGNAYTPDVYRALFENPRKHVTPTCCLVFMGVNAAFDENWGGLCIRREQPVTLGGRTMEDASLLNFSYDATTAPEGKTVMLSYYGADFDFWNALSKEDYAKEKERLRQDAMAVLVKRYPQAEGKIEVTDVVTPLTYVRYCDAWRGSWMSWLDSGKDVPRYFPGRLSGLDNFLMAGMWTLPPGGLPGAVASGRFAAHRITLAQGRAFKTR